ncbi:MAG TPA: response regulator, partial [Chloroflexota bacterium]
MHDHRRAEAVVVAEDHDALRDVIVRLLTADGYRVSAHADGVDALAALADTPADLLVTDLGLPGLDGLALIEQARQRDPTLAVVVITSSDTTA